MKRDFKDFFNIKLLYKLAFLLSLSGLFILIFDFGFDQPTTIQNKINGFFLTVLCIGIFTTVLRYLTQGKNIEAKVILFDSLSIIITLLVIYFHFFSEEAYRQVTFLYSDNWIKITILLTFIREFSEQKINYKRTLLNPAQLFIISFLGIIFLGTLLLMLPNATFKGISFLDALFTSTSAVCVTGLIVVDTGTYFTQFGQTIILVLIQAGGIGILTFASYFSYFFKGVSSYENQLVLSDLTNSEKIGEVFSILKKILIITFSIEILGAFFIYFSLNNSLLPTFFDRSFFAIFHSISAFCNAGFSTLTAGLYETGFKFNYGLQSIIILLLTIGGLGFPIIANLIKYLKYHVANKILDFKKSKMLYKPWVLSLNSRITLITTFSLLILGTVFFYLSEYNNTLVEHQGIGKFVTALFGSATPRTAGFNTIDMNALNIATVMMTILLMWIGASPASTGGGIKTSTFAIAIFNFISLAKGKSRIEIYRREISDISVRRAFATIMLSLIVIGFGIIAILVFDPDKELLGIAFECFSAYSTVGLSLGITASLSAPSKLIIILIMFIGRVSMLSILIAIFKKVKHKNYKYPTEEITIN
ncbi:TrkH family potassium uptake protein [Lutibacter sp.]|uniref:TrkH family potassium uptake protein n=1 Tax=Lutibacter sp. TaxID=1925666 RepID=UPI0027344EB1|nr:potassium transporter TrkG [Lutibacter sp.]MDP3313807.1 potassium transporter TrkG [Lutibacter sp.]